MKFRDLRLLLVLSIPALIAAAPAAKTPGGLYSDAQAVAGGVLYSAHCAICHGRMLEGTFETPALQGRFIANWSNAPLSAMFDYIRNAMPQSAPGSLGSDENAKILAFLLKMNGFPSGGQELSPAQTASMRMLKPSVGKAAAPNK